MRMAFPSVAAGRSQMVGTGMSYKTSRWLKTRLFRNTGPKWDRNPTETKCGASPSKTHLRACRGRGISLGRAEKILVDSRKPWLLLLQRLLTLSPTNTSTQLSSGFSHPVFSFKMAGGEGNNPSLPSPAPARPVGLLSLGGPSLLCLGSPTSGI